jgi:uridine kinase
MSRRQEVLDTVARAASGPIASDVTRVAIDGVDGAGKTYFADELAEVLGASGRSVIRASVDGFDNPRSIR